MTLPFVTLFAGIMVGSLVTVGVQAFLQGARDEDRSGRR